MGLSKNLHSLIKSLDKSEKRYFSLASDRSKIYYKIFEIFDRFDDYKKDQVDEDIKRLKFSGNVATHKSMLYDRILMALRDYSKDISKSAIIKQMLVDVEILYHKRLFEQSRIVLEKAKKMCRIYQEFELLLHAHVWDRLIRFTDGHEFLDSDELDHFHNDQRETLKLCGNNIAYRIYKDRVFAYYMKYGDLRREEQKAELNKLASDTPNEEPLSTSAKAEYITTLSVKHYAVREHETSFNYNLDLENVYNSDPDYKKANYIRYGTVLSNTVRAHMYLADYEKSIEKLEEVKEIPIKTYYQKVWLFQNYYLVRMTLLSGAGRFKEAAELADFVEEKLPQFESNLNNIHMFYYRLAYLRFGNEQYSLSLRMLNKLLSIKGIRSDLLGQAHIINLILHYEMKNHELVIYGIKSVYRYLKKRGHLHNYEKVLLQGLGQMLRSRQPKTEIEIFDSLRQNLSQLEDRTAEIYFNYHAWLTSKIKKTTYGEELRKITKI